MCKKAPLNRNTINTENASLLLFVDGEVDVGALKIEEGRPLALHEVDVSFSSFLVGKVDH